DPLERVGGAVQGNQAIMPREFFDDVRDVDVQRDGLKAVLVGEVDVIGECLSGTDDPLDQHGIHPQGGAFLSVRRCYPKAEKKYRQQRRKPPAHRSCSPPSIGERSPGGNFRPATRWAYPSRRSDKTVLIRGR